MSSAVSPRVRVRVVADRIEVGAETLLLEGAGRVGALVSFVGYCRDEDGRLAGLELEHYPGMAERELARIAAVAAERFTLLGVSVVHRFGLMRPGEEIVFVGCAAAHRGAAFAAVSFLMDTLKTSAPFWKREHMSDGTVGGWVEAKASDSAAMDRWHRL